MKTKLEIAADALAKEVRKMIYGLPEYTYAHLSELSDSLAEYEAAKASAEPTLAEVEVWMEQHAKYTSLTHEHAKRAINEAKAESTLSEVEADMYWISDGAEASSEDPSEAMQDCDPGFAIELMRAKSLGNRWYFITEDEQGNEEAFGPFLTKQEADGAIKARKSGGAT